MNIFVTGATGFIGRHFLSSLCKKLSPKDTCFVLSRHRIHFSDPRIVILLGELEDIAQFEKEVLSADYFFHIAAVATYGNQIDYNRVNHLPTIKIVDLLAQSRVLKNFIFISSIGAVDRLPSDPCSQPLTINSIPHPNSGYGQSKLASENYIMASSIPYTIIRPTWVYGQHMRSDSHINQFVSMVYERKKVIHFNFPGKVSMVHVNDLSTALVNCIDNDTIIRQTYFAETETYSIGDFFKIIFEKIKKRKLFQIKVPCFHTIVSRLHAKLPLSITNLFLDYLVAKDPRFLTDFGLGDIRQFSTHVEDVISTNRYNGYWVITGANSGIGLALAKQLHALGKPLMLIDKNTNNLSPYQDPHIVIEGDLSSLSELERIAEMVNRHTVYCLINNAGVGYKGGLHELNMDKIQQIINVNILCPVMFTKLLLSNLIKHKSIIINIGSSVAYNPLPHMSIYAASKAFLVNWSESLSYELKQSNRVITFSPSGTHTNFQDNAGVKTLNNGNGLLSPEYVASKMIAATKQNKNHIILSLKTRLLLFLSSLLSKRNNVFFWGKLFEKFR